MKKVIVMIVIISAMITFGSVCGAADKTGDKKGYVVKESFSFKLVPNPATGNPPWGPWGSSEGRVYCAKNDFVTGCSYALYSYPGYTQLSDYAFLNVIPIECTPDLKEEDAGVAVCKGCLVTLTVNHPDPPPDTIPPDVTPTDGWFRVYAYCGSSNNNK